MVDLDTVEGLRAEIERLTDLVRYQRAELHDEGLITNAEYARLAQIKGSPARLEGYDAVRYEADRLRAAVTHAAEVVDLLDDAFHGRDGVDVSTELATLSARLRAALTPDGEVQS